MGYILPVNHYQYQDYQTRITQKDRSPFALEKVFKATLDNKMKHNHSSDQERVEDQRVRSIHIPRSAHALNNLHPVSQIGTEKILSNMTGKGRHFSETV